MSKRSEPSTLRAFVALSISPEAKSFLDEFTKSAVQSFPDYRFTQTRNLHITLQFLGDVERSQVLPITKALASRVSGQTSFEIGLGEAGCFPNRGTPRILHVSVAPGADRLEVLAGSVRSGLSSLGFIPDKPFSAHITLGRRKSNIRRDLRKDGGDGGDSGDVATRWSELFKKFKNSAGSPKWQVTSVSLMESILGPGGPTYIERGKAELST